MDTTTINDIINEMKDYAKHCQGPIAYLLYKWSDELQKTTMEKTI